MTRSTTPVCPRNTCVQNPPSTSNTRTVRSAELVASNVPVASTAQSAIGAECGLKVRRHSPVEMFHRFTTRDREQAKMVSPLPSKQSAVMGSVSPENVLYLMI